MLDYSNSEFNLARRIPIDAHHSLDQISSHFQSTKDGLPELVKNSKDQYSRLKLGDISDRQIVVAGNHRLKRILVLDFAGATADEFELWKEWSSRVASRIDAGDDIEAGFGNGGKSFMVRGSRNVSYMESCYKGLRTKMGFLNQNESDRYKPGYALEGRRKFEVHNLIEDSPKTRLNETLGQFGLSIDALPDSCQRMFKKRNSFTAVVIEQVKDWENRRSQRHTVEMIPEILASHPQANLTVQTCQVWVFLNDQLRPDPISVVRPDPLVGFEDLPPIALPKFLIDPRDGQEVEVSGLLKEASRIHRYIDRTCGIFITSFS